MIVSLGLALFSLIFLILIKYTRDKLKETKKSLDSAIEKKYELTLQVENFKLAEKIKSDNRKEADEKINALHNGDAVDNAISGLSVK